MDKKHKIWLELIAKKATPLGGIPIKESVGILNAVGKVAKKYNFETRVRGIPKDIADYKPSGKEIQIHFLSDIVQKLTPEQFEMFIIDLRKWVEHGREIKKMRDNPKEIQKIAEIFGAEVQVEKNWQFIKDGMTWLDTGENKRITNIIIES